jgi:hypothetical protein
MDASGALRSGGALVYGLHMADKNEMRFEGLTLTVESVENSLAFSS